MLAALIHHHQWCAFIWLTAHAVQHALCGVRGLLLSKLLLIPWFKLDGWQVPGLPEGFAIQPFWLACGHWRPSRHSHDGA
jgi:hypothetical protein